jgi:hypothetical protein
MTRWMIEKDGTGIEKSGTGIRKGLLTCFMAVFLFAGNLNAGNVNPAGSLQLVVQNNKVAVSWIIGDSIFSGISSLDGSFASLMLTEISLSTSISGLNVTGNGTGSSIEVTGNGTGSSIEVTGNGTGSSTEVTGNGTGSSTEVTGNGTGASALVTGNGTGVSIDVTGNGTGSSTQVTGNGTGASADVTGNGTGSAIQVTGNGSGADAITITLPEGTGMAMEVFLSCGSATVAVIDSNSVEVVAFNKVEVIGDKQLCGHFAANSKRKARYN